MNLHFIFSLLYIIGWMFIAVKVNNSSIKTKSYKSNLDKITKLRKIIIALGAGFLPVLINGFLDLGFSIKIIKRNKEVGNLRYV